ncbi:hypothetical protein OF83DRAFT_1082068 [Amylostereum chailletii]|nr:hypothetical protein OF83DRAFT_1082068 [Amylostereum chailletii]
MDKPGTSPNLTPPPTGSTVSKPSASYNDPPTSFFAGSHSPSVSRPRAQRIVSNDYFSAQQTYGPWASESIGIVQAEEVQNIAPNVPWGWWGRRPVSRQVLDIDMDNTNRASGGTTAVDCCGISIRTHPIVACFISRWPIQILSRRLWVFGCFLLFFGVVGRLWWAYSGFNLAGTNFQASVGKLHRRRSMVRKRDRREAALTAQSPDRESQGSMNPGGVRHIRYMRPLRESNEVGATAGDVRQPGAHVVFIQYEKYRKTLTELEMTLRRLVHKLTAAVAIHAHSVRTAVERNDRGTAKDSYPTSSVATPPALRHRRSGGSVLLTDANASPFFVPTPA